MDVLVTRPREDAEPLAGELAARGYRVWLAPMLSVAVESAAVESAARPDLSGVQALLFTSANGARAFAALSPRRDVPVLAVGEATATAARDAGFTAVESAGGDAGALATLVQARLTPGAGRLYHAAGSATAGDLRARLENAGFAVRREILYHAHPAERLPPEVQQALARRQLGAALFFSPRTADTFVTLTVEGGLGDACRSLRAVCLSNAVAERVSRLAWHEVRVAATPTRADLVRALDALAKTGANETN